MHSFLNSSLHIQSFKKLLFVLLAALCITGLFQSCKVEKRLHRPGYHVEWIKPKGQSKVMQANKPKGLRHDPPKTWDDKAVPELTASASNEHYNLFLTEELTKLVESLEQSMRQEARRMSTVEHHQSETVSQNTCDTIFLFNGEIIVSRVAEINPDDIRYYLCETAGDSLITLSKDIVSKIIYSNGSADSFNTVSSQEELVSEDRTEQASSEPTRRKFEFFGIASVVVAIAGLFFFGYILGPLAALMGITSLLTMNHNPGRYKGRGFAFLGIFLGIAAILVSLILMNRSAMP